MRLHTLAHFFTRRVGGVHEAAYILAIFTFTSQLVALVRDRIFAHQFGAGEVLDVFYAAFRIPDTMYALLASLVSVFVLIPFFEQAQVKGKDALRAMFSEIFSFFSFLLIVVALCLWYVTPAIVHTLYSTFSAEMQEMLISLVHILLLQPLLLGASNLFGAYLQMKERFLLYAVAPLLYNVGIIFGALYLYPVFGVAGLGWGVVVGALLHLLVQMPFAIRDRVVPRIRIPRYIFIRRLVSRAVPRALALSAQQVTLLVLISLVSGFAIGSVSVFSFAWNLQAVPLAIIGASYSVAVFPKLSAYIARGDVKKYRLLVSTAVRSIAFFALPVSALFILLNEQVVRVVLESGAFSVHVALLTAQTLSFFVSSLVAQGLVVLLTRACYAAGNTTFPLMANTISTIITIVVAVFIARILGVREVSMIALSYSLGMYINMMLFVWYFEKTYGGIIHTFTSVLRQTAPAVLALSVVVYGIVHTLSPFGGGPWGVFIQGCVAGVAGVSVWGLVLFITKNKDFMEIVHSLRIRLTIQKVDRSE